MLLYDGPTRELFSFKAPHTIAVVGSLWGLLGGSSIMVVDSTALRRSGTGGASLQPTV